MRKIFTLCFFISVATVWIAIYHSSLDAHLYADQFIAENLGGNMWQWYLFLPGLGIVFFIITNLALRKPIRLHLQNDPEAKHSATTWMCLLFGLVFFLAVQLAFLAVEISLVARGEAIKMVFALGLMYFLIMGNYITTTRRTSGNGFRTPWALKDDVIWEKTQRFCGRGLFIVTLSAMGMLFFFPVKFVSTGFIIVLITMKLIAAFYSWSLWRQLQRGQLGASSG